jgi:hypothetical protein
MRITIMQEECDVNISFTFDNISLNLSLILSLSGGYFGLVINRNCGFS